MRVPTIHFVVVQNPRGRIFTIALAGLLGLAIVIGIIWQLLLPDTLWGMPWCTDTSSKAACEELKRQAKADRADISNVEDEWVPQLASALPGQDVNGVTVDYTHIWKEHQDWREKYPKARLVWSGDWSSFEHNTFVTVLAVHFNTGDEVNSWCDQQGIHPERCYAKKLSKVSDPSESTKYRTTETEGLFE